MKRRLIRLGGIVLIILAVLVPTVRLLNHWTSTTASGTVHVGTPAGKQAVIAKPQPVPIKTSYFTSELPSGFSIRRSSETPDSTVTLQSLVANEPSPTDQQFALTIGVLPGTGLRGNGDYNLRITDSATYIRYAPPNLPAGAEAFRTSSGPASFVVFWPHGSRYAEIALSTDGGSNLAQLHATFSQVVSQWTWK
jgi:hypothetical protein